MSDKPEMYPQPDLKALAQQTTKAIVIVTEANPPKAGTARQTMRNTAAEALEAHAEKSSDKD